MALKAKNAFSENGNAVKNLIWISDFQIQGNTTALDKDSTFTYNMVKLTPASVRNFSIDTLFIDQRQPSTLEVSIELSSSSTATESVPVSLYNGNTLIAKTAVEFVNSKRATTTFSIPSQEEIEGMIRIEDDGLAYDDHLYFTLNRPAKIKVLAINNAEGGFLRRLYNDEEFLFSEFSFNSLEYSKISEQNLVVLNGATIIPNSLVDALASFREEGGSLLIIPALDSELSSLNTLLSRLQLGTMQRIVEQERRLTTIQYDHPLIKEVFSDRVRNFQYPVTKSFFELNSSATSILDLDDGQPFLIENDNAYLFTAPLDSDNSSFVNSPFLMVPVLYSIGMNSLAPSPMYYTIGKEQRIDVAVQLQQDEVLSLRNEVLSFIPRQRTFRNKVAITTAQDPAKDGTYTLLRGEQELGNVSFNYSRNESKLNYMTDDMLEDLSLNESVVDALDKLSTENKVESLWKWFVIFALVFLGIEVLILKYVK